MNILLINYEFPPVGGGAANATYFMAREMIKIGHSVTVLTSKFNEKKGYSQEEGIHVYRIPAIRKSQHKSNIMEMMSFVISAYSHIGSIISKQQIEKAVIFFTIPSGFLGPYILKRFKIPYIISLRGGDVPGLEPSLIQVHKRLKILRQYILRRSSGIVANSKGLAAASEKVDPFPVSIIPNGVDTSFFQAVEKSESKTPMNILFVGRFQEQKNLFFLVKQFAVFAATKKEVYLTLVGDGPNKTELLKTIQDLGIDNKVKFLDWTNKGGLRTIYQQADCLINPSIYEGMPNVVLEGMACGLPVIASKIMGNEELVEEGKNGFLFKLDDADTLQKAFKWLYEHREERVQMGKVSRKKVEENYSWSKVAKEYIDLLNK